MRELALFAGAGGGLLASTHLLGWDTVCGVELNEHCRNVLMQRQREGFLPFFPLWDDIRTFDGTIWRGHVDVVSGGFPCQDISSAGRGAGLDGDRSGLWFEMLRVIGEVRPAYVFAENSPMLRTRGLSRVLQGLADLGYDAAWGVLGAWHVGAPIRRDRLWVLAKSDAVNGCETQLGDRQGPRSDESRPIRGDAGGDMVARGRAIWELSATVESGLADGVADRVGELSALGNGQVPAVAELAWHVLSATLVEGCE